jgi:hypothetical protein
MAAEGGALEPGRREVNHDSLSWDCMVMLIGRGRENVSSSLQAHDLGIPWSVFPKICLTAIY